MSPRLLSVALLLTSFTGLARAAAEAPITSVVLYPGSATVERTAQVPAGSNTLEISGLPNNFDSKTLLVQAERGIRIGQVVVRDVGKEAGAHPREKELQKKLRELKDQLDTLDIEVKSAGMVTGYLDKMGGAAAGDKGLIDGRTLLGVVDSIETSATRAYQRAQKAEIRKRQIQEEHDRIAFELTQLQSGARDSRVVTVQAVAERPGQMRLSYQVNRAGWQPTYRAALDSNKSTVDLERLAMISQKTGEDWKGVKLKLSTGQPQAWRDPVDPHTRGLVYHAPLAREDAREARALQYAAAPAPAAASRLKAVSQADDAYVAPVIETEGAFATEFEVPAAVSLPADGREVSVVLGKQNFAVTQRVQVSPSINKTGVLTAEFERPSGVWLPGNIQIYRDGNYVGATRWRPDASERFLLGFGQDDLLRVSVDRKALHAGSSGFVGQRAQRKVADTFSLVNLHRAPLEVLVVEAFPVSQSEEIEVERRHSPAPDQEDWKGRPGVVAWNRKLAPNETWKIDVGYTVTYPKEGRVTGLP